MKKAKQQVIDRSEELAELLAQLQVKAEEVRKVSSQLNDLKHKAAELYTKVVSDYSASTILLLKNGDLLDLGVSPGALRILTKKDED